MQFSPSSFIFCKLTINDRLYCLCRFINSVIITTMFNCTDYGIQCLFYRLAYSLQHADCAGAVFYSVMKSALVAAQSTNGRFL
jgi:hypothetical protein